MLTSNQRGRGNEPVVVDGRTRSFVTVNIVQASRLKRWQNRYMIEWAAGGGKQGGWSFPPGNPHSFILESVAAVGLAQ
jgi:hypothetical protein